jgi:hypothetical protein
VRFKIIFATLSQPPLDIIQPLHHPANVLWRLSLFTLFEASVQNILGEGLLEMNVIDYLIVGAGPAGLQMGYFLKKRGVDYLILERSAEAGSFFARYPRHRQLLSINKVNTGCSELEARLRYDWNSLLSDDERLLVTRSTQSYFPDASVLVKYLEGFRRRHRLKVRFGVEVVRMSKQAGCFKVESASGDSYLARRLLIATDLHMPYLPDIPGIELCHHYATGSLDPELFQDKTVLIVGKGNSAFETAQSLNEVARKIQMCGPDPVRHAWDTHFAGDLRAVNCSFLDTYHLKTQNSILNGRLTRVERTGQMERYAPRLAMRDVGASRSTMIEFYSAPDFVSTPLSSTAVADLRWSEAVSYRR